MKTYKEYYKILKQPFFWIMIITTFFLGYLLNNNKHIDYIPNPNSIERESNTTWTCSMHPQIKLPEPGKCPICFMDLIPVESNYTISEIQTQLKMSENAVKLAEIQTTYVRRSPALAEIILSGRVEIDETRQKTISAWMPGRLERLYVDYTGISVKKDEHLVDIYSPELYSAQEVLIQARKSINISTSGNNYSKEIAETNLQAAREKLYLLGLNDNQIAQIESQDSPDNRITLFSPLSGVITGKYANQGDYVQTGTKIYSITDLSKVWIILDAYESDLFWLRYAQTVHFEIEALPGESFEGRIAFINPVLDPKTRTVTVRINMDNKDGKLKPGMFVRGTIHASLDAKGNSINPQLAGKWISPMHPEIVKDHPGTCDICGMPLVKAEELGIVKQAKTSQLPILVPVSAVLKTGRRAIVYVKVPNTSEPTYESREIVVSARAGDYYIIESGLIEGEEIVVNGNFKIDSAMQIAGKPSMMNPAEKRTTKIPDNIATVNPQKDQIPSEFYTALTPLYETYISSQESLADDNFEQSRDYLKKLRDLFNQVNINDFNLSEIPRNQFTQIREQLKNTTKHIEHMQSIADIRNVFKDISIAVLKMEKLFGHSGKDTYYESFCPMAFDNKGASWLAKEQQISNPFFGSKMLRCGEVRNTFQPQKDIR